MIDLHILTNGLKNLKHERQVDIDKYRKKTLFSKMIE